MKYATWKFYFPNGDKYGYTADQEIMKKGFTAWGMFHIDENTIFGTFQEGADTSGLENYAFRELTTEEAEEILIIVANRQIISM